MTLNGPTSLMDSKREAVASGDAVEGDTKEYRPPIDELLSSAREDVARLAQILRPLHCSAVLRGMDGAPWTHAELWAPIHNVDGRPIASLELGTGDIDCPGSLKKLLDALIQSFARAIAERWFRLSYRRLWVIAAVAQGEADKSMLLAIDREQRVVGADRRARQGLEARGRSIQAPCTLSTFFQIHDVNVRAMRYRDVAIATSEASRYRAPVSAGRCGREIFTEALSKGVAIVFRATEVLPPQSHSIPFGPIHPPKGGVVERVRGLPKLICRIPVEAVVMIEVCCDVKGADLRRFHIVRTRVHGE